MHSVTAFVIFCSSWDKSVLQFRIVANNAGCHIVIIDTYAMIGN